MILLQEDNLLAKGVEHEPRNGITLGDTHHSDFAFSYGGFSPLCNDGGLSLLSTGPGPRFYICQPWPEPTPEAISCKKVVLDPNHQHSPFPAPFIIHEMRCRGFNPWCADRPIVHPQSATYDFGGSSGMHMQDGIVERQVLVANSRPQE